MWIPVNMGFHEETMKISLREYRKRNVLVVSTAFRKKE